LAGNDKKSPSRWRLIVVGGHTRSIGKTQLLCDVISAFRAANWIAGKITQYGHGVCAQNGENCGCAPDEHVCAISWETQADTGTDSARFLAWGPSFVLAADETGISCRRPAASEGRAPTDDRSWCDGTSASDRRKQFLAAIPQTQLVSRSGRSGERRFQGFGSRGSGPRGCSSAPGIVAHFPIQGTGVGETSPPIASSKTIGIARRG